MLLKENETYDHLLEDWPLHYYEVRPAEIRRTLLQQKIAQNPDSTDEMRLHILNTRYGTDGNDHDGFLRAWMMLKTKEEESPGFLLRRQREKEVQECMKALMIPEGKDNELIRREWENFAETLIRSHAESGVFRSVMFGMMRVSDENAAKRMVWDIRVVTEIVPGKYGLEEQMKPLRDVLHEVFSRRISNASACWDSVFSD